MIKFAKYFANARSGGARQIAKYITWSVLCCVVGCGAVDVTTYNGDGMITSKGSNPINAGYTVDFESFPLDEAYSAEYTLRGLPKIDKSGHIGLIIGAAHADLVDVEDAVISINLKSGGESFYTYKGKLSSCIPSLSREWDIYCEDAEGAFMLDEAILDSKSEFKLRVGYEPGKKSRNDSAFFRLSRGGRY